ncbi:AlpA family phage regulatory protein [Sulfitobacter sp. TSTF-M16]|uniref:AlpA family phage regulatory protein n=2 Tax=Sulfitobacter aestuariivivens TaxID=2766981 RepID=A0A927DBE7_9RHOB|nr:AlpA family phage regulatory protein [Sulfitobacter aestuariivivens]MBD3666181.1 AlpA family phage regulatory protein [Sulfitobacter aestuariivivens]
MNTAQYNEKPWVDCPPTGRLLRPREVFDRTGLSRSQVYAMIAEGDFPPFLKVSTRAAAMPEAWLDCFVKHHALIALGHPV